MLVKPISFSPRAGGGLDGALDTLDDVVERLVRRSEMHVVVDDQASLGSGSPRSADSLEIGRLVTLIRRGRPAPP